MPVEVVWDNEAHTILRQIYRGYTTLDDYIVATDEVLRLAKTVPHTVHSIMDRTHILSTPGSLMPALRYANANVPPNLGARVIVKPTMFTRILVDIGRRIAPRLTDKVHFANTVDEAHTLINHQYIADPELMV